MVKRQDSGQPPFDSPGDPRAGKPGDEKHPGTRKRSEPGPAQAPAEGNDPSLTRAPSRVRKPRQ